MTPHPERKVPLAVTLFCITAASFACLLTRWVAGIAGAEWKLATALAIGVGLGVLVVFCACGGGPVDGEGG